jgi:hypothetical protein
LLKKWPSPEIAAAAFERRRIGDIEKEAYPFAMFCCFYSPNLIALSCNRPVFGDIVVSRLRECGAVG